MAILKIKHRVSETEANHFGPRKYHDPNSFHDVIHYVMSPEKTPSGYIGGIAVNPHNAVYEMEHLSRYYGQDRGVRLRHMILSFAPGEFCRRNATKQARIYAYQFAYPIAAIYGNSYQIVYAVHEDTNNPHIHFAMSTTNYVTGLKYPGTKADLYQFKAYIESVLEPFNIHVEIIADRPTIKARNGF